MKAVWERERWGQRGRGRRERESSNRQDKHSEAEGGGGVWVPAQNMANKIEALEDRNKQCRPKNYPLSRRQFLLYCSKTILFKVSKRAHKGKTSKDL